MPLKRLIAVLLSLVCIAAALVAWHFQPAGSLDVRADSTVARTATTSSDCVDDASVGTIAWTSPGNAAATDGTSATAAITKNGGKSHFIKCTNFGFTSGMFPAGSTITGATITVTRSAATAGGIQDLAVRLVKGGTIGSTDRSTATYWGTSLSAEAHGSSSDMWGTTLSISDVTASTFGAAVAAQQAGNAGGTITTSIDSIAITIYYTPPAATLVQRHGLLQNDDGATVNSDTNLGSVDTTLTGMRIGQRVTARFQLDNTGSIDATSDQFSLQYDKNDNNWQPVIAGKDIRPANGQAGNNGDALTSAAAGACYGGAIFSNGVWQRNTSTSSPVTIAVGKCSEVAFVVDTAGASLSTTYRLRLYYTTYAQTLSSYSAYPTFTTVATGSDVVRAGRATERWLANCGDPAWGCESVTSGTTTIGQESVGATFDAAGVLWVSYMDATTQRAAVAHYVGSGGSCPNTAWTCDTLNNVGASAYTSIATGPDGAVWMSFYQQTTNYIYVAQYVGSGGTCAYSSAWSCTVIDNTGTASGFPTAIGVGVSGTIWVAWFNNATADLMVAQYVGSGGNCSGSTAWNCMTIDSTGTQGRYASLAVDAVGNPWISYTDATNSLIKVANYVGSGGNCSGSTAWNCSALDSGSSFTAIAVSPAGQVWASYFASTPADLIVAQYVGSAGNCPQSAAWQCTTVDSTGAVGQFAKSIGFDAAGRAWVSYFDGTNSNLKVAWYVGSGGNCSGSILWSCTTVETSGSNVGKYSALAVDSHGDIWLGYMGVGMFLKVANLHVPGSETVPGRMLDDVGYGNISALADAKAESTQATSDLPFFRFDTVSATNTATIQPTWVGQSSVAAASNNLILQVYRYGTTNAWQTLATQASCAANTACTITPSAITTNLSEYYQAYGSQYLLHVRLYQAAGSSKILSTDCFSAGSACTVTPSGPTMDQLLRHGTWFNNGVKQPMSFKK